MKLKVTLLTGRTIDQGTSKEYGKLSEQYRENVAICEIDPDDLKELGISENTNVRVTTEHGSVIVEARSSRRAPHAKIVYMPYGLWVNLLVDSQTHGTGMPSFKGIPAELEAAPAVKVLTMRELLKTAFRE